LALVFVQGYSQLHDVKLQRLDRNMSDWREHLNEGQVIPASPLALDASGDWSERYQRALTSYYIDSGAGGIAAGVHTTQFAIRDHGLLEPVLRAISETVDSKIASQPRPFVRIAGLCGATPQAIREAELARSLGFHTGLLSTAAVKEQSEPQILEHCRLVAEVMPIFGFYLQPAVGGRVFSSGFWRAFCEIENVVAIKIAAFNRYQTIDVVRAVMESGRDDIALYTGNDDNIIADLLTPFRFGQRVRWMSGGLLGQWAVWTQAAVEMLEQIKWSRQRSELSIEWLAENVRLTDANAAIFDASHHFAGCIAGVNEVLRRQGLLPSARCLDPREILSPGQADEISRVSAGYRSEDRFVAANLDRWLG
jgi:dihydrodipicolinate synthase/N-acetylneuraminate lyase